jgi:exopolysaccharide/PEP-CTERM locus tyrosine autokinase
MSIIEKAVDTLQNQARSKVDGPAEGDSANTVQRAAGAEVPVVSQVVHENVSQSVVGASAAGVREARRPIVIPFDSLQQLGYLTPSIPRSAIAEEYRTIKRPLLTNIAGHSAVPIKNANLIMVTSALQGDGKTYSSINLAMSIAMEQDKTVLFVDADTAKAEAGRVLGVPPGSPGLIDVLEDKGVNVSDVILRTNVEKLRILPAGNVHAHSNELLASAVMRRLMLELSERYSDRVIVFDSPPLLLTTEAGVLANLMGQIVFVVGAETTPQNAVAQAMEHIGQDKTVGLVLNRARRHSKLFGYGYGYSYRQYGYGYGSREREPASGE